MVNVGINGFGRIGRLVLRASLEKLDSNVKVVAINDIGNISQNAHLLKYDSVHGKINEKIKVEDNIISVGENKISFSVIKSNFVKRMGFYLYGKCERVYNPSTGCFEFISV